MPFLLLGIAGLLIISAIRNTQGNLATALETDIPGFFKWAIAIIAIAALGWVPGMREISRWLLALVLVVILLKNYTGLFANIQQLSQQGPPAPTPGAQTPAAAYAANPSSPQITQADVSGTTANINSVALAAPTTNPVGAFDPAAFLTAFENGTGGFGGTA